MENKRTNLISGNIKVPQYEKYFSRVASIIKPSPLRKAAAQEIGSVAISMSAGLPHPEVFPIRSTEITLSDGTKVCIEGEEQKSSLQYGSSFGMDELRDWLKGLIKRVHDPPTFNVRNQNREMELMIIAGCQHGVSTSFQMLLNEGDTVLIQKPSYATMFNMLLPRGMTPVGVESDEEGLSAQRMRKLLQNWAEENPIGKTARRPKVLYCVPTGENPRSCSWSLKRRKEVYEVCREFDMLIMEDDPYYFTHYTRPLPKSFLSLDEDGRVLRYDSLSKIIGPGLRIGFASGPKSLIAKLEVMYQPTIATASTVTQAMALSIFRHWGYDGFDKHCIKVAQFIKQKADYIVDAAKTYLSDVAEWTHPDSGMFLWLKLKHVEDSEEIVAKCFDQGVQFVKGSHAIVGTDKSPYIRIAFALPSQNQILKAFQTLAKVTKEVIGDQCKSK